ncbi:MAG: hypothetical protein IKP20_03715 [Candidatus Methanomethylophilaceae archaeon]|jgi:hypothetical protein|nr:hypothetical protein [Candidatus Methanomethylophilaceae archaeon]
MADKYAITPGSRFIVHHGKEGITEGTLKGITVMGGSTAMAFELDDGVMRYINSTAIQYMDLIGDAPEEEKPQKDVGNVYYG